MEDPEAAWNKGRLRHILPTASHSEFLIKASFDDPLKHAPVLWIEDRAIEGTQTDTSGRFWKFRVISLEPARTYELVLKEAIAQGGKALCDPWQLQTFPSPDSHPQRMRVLFYTCAGGDENSGVFLPAETRSRLLRRALSFAPDAVIANGDHVYRDLRPQRHWNFGLLTGSVAERKLPVLGTDTEEFVKRAGDRQIVDVYGVDFRSVPTFFIQDDHDYFENDEATEKLITFPPDPFMTELARVTQSLYYPEFLPDGERPDDLPGARRDENGQRISESFGTVRYGRLFEALLYTVRRTLTMSGDTAVFVGAGVEKWLLERMANDDTDHVVNVPSNPPGWTAGKWGEWYPDHYDSNGVQIASPPKKFWQQGWLRQHDRILTAISAMKNRIPLIVSGDIHASALGRISGTGLANLSANPVIAVLCGTVGTGRGWPSRSRGAANPPLHLDMEQLVSPIENNGFTIADFSTKNVVLRMFVWNARTQRPAEIDNLQPFKTFEFDRPQ